MNELRNAGPDTMTRYYGKYRGTVVNNIDPEGRGRIQPIVPDVQGLTPTTWAMPCLPVAGLQMGIFSVPPVGSGVWIEFEQGDPDYPIWVGGFVGSALEVPAMARIVPPAIPGITLQTPAQNGITISDMRGPAGGIVLKASSGALISISDAGITISNGKGATIVMTGPTVSINQTALVVT